MWKHQSTQSAAQTAIKEISAHQLIKWNMKHVHTNTHISNSQHKEVWNILKTHTHFLETPHYIIQAAAAFWVLQSF